MKSRLIRSLLGIAALTTLAGAASAGPVTWTLSGVTFAQGGTASGSFAYDADTDTYSSINISTTTDSQATGTTGYDTVLGFSNHILLSVVKAAEGPDFTGDHSLRLFFTSPLTSLGGTASLATFEGEWVCINSACSSEPLRYFASGSVVSESVSGTPEPATALLLVPACGLIAWRRRKSAKN